MKLIHSKRDQELESLFKITKTRSKFVIKGKVIDCNNIYIYMIKSCYDYLLW